MAREKTQGTKAPEGVPDAQPEVVQPAIPAPAQQPQGQRERPVHEVRIGRIKAAVWANKDKEQGTWYSVSITRSYKDNSTPPVWKQAHTFGRDDLLVVSEVSRLCWLFIAQQSGSKLDGNGHSTSEEPIPF